MRAIHELEKRGDEPRPLPQTVYEFWAVATRPITNNGLGLSPAAGQIVVTNFLNLYPLIQEGSSVFSEWLGIVSSQPCLGKVAHDARYVAAMRSLGLTHLMTFNSADFARFAGITVIDPSSAVPPGPGITP